MQFGGRGRQAWVEVAEDVDWQAAPREANGKASPDGRLVVYVATPALWPDGWRIPTPLGGVEVSAAAVADAQPVATATPRAGGRPGDRALRWAVPAGSVYCLRFPSAGEAAAWAYAMHGTAYGRERGTDCARQGSEWC
ncbi:type III-B CRISPR module-associated Cmr3 family protein [Streptomyces sp. INA 01156]